MLRGHRIEEFKTGRLAWREGAVLTSPSVLPEMQWVLGAHAWAGGWVCICVCVCVCVTVARDSIGLPNDAHPEGHPSINDEP